MALTTTTSDATWTSHTIDWQDYIEDLYHRALNETEPFEETREFRDFMVWLCGYTDRKQPPSKEDWEALRDKVKLVAAKFTTKAHDKALKKVKENVRSVEQHKDFLRDRYITQVETATGTKFQF